jgi:hypothetical protein
MSRSEFELFLNVGIGLCAIMVVFSLLRSRSRGISAYCLSGAFAALGGLLFGLREKWSEILLIACGVVVGGCLVADFILRAAQRQDLD